MKNLTTQSRRNFLRTSLVGGTAALSSIGTSFHAFSAGDSKRSRVSLSAGDDRTENIFSCLKRFEKEIKKAIGSKRVIIKPNNVSTTTQLSASHAGCLEGILEFLQSIGIENVIIAESAASGPSFEGFENYGYIPLAEKYKAKLVDLDKEDYELVYCVDEQKIHPHACRMSGLLLDRNNFVISSAVMKTHDRVVATLSLKNIVVGAPIKDDGFRWGRGGKAGAKNDKPITHGNGYRGINYNLFALAPRLHPDLAIIDGFEGMEGNGPVGGSPVDHRVAVASLDWLAADRVSVELMGIDFSKIGYLNFCANAGMGQADLAKIDIEGADLKSNIKQYELSRSYEKQLEWMM